MTRRQPDDTNRASGVHSKQNSNISFLANVSFYLQETHLLNERPNKHLLTNQKLLTLAFSQLQHIIQLEQSPPNTVWTEAEVSVSFRNNLKNISNVINLVDKT